MKRQSSSKVQSVIIAILAILLVGIMTTGVTYAFFTDKDTASDRLTFGTIKIEDVAGSDGNIVVFDGTDAESRTEIMPGDTITTDFTIALDENSEDAWVRFKLLASVSEATYAGVLGFDSYGVKNLLVDDEGPIATVYLIFKGEEYVIANGTTVSKYVDGVATALTAAEADEKAEVLAAAKNYVYTFTIGDDVYEITFAGKLDTDESSVIGVLATVEKNETALNPALEEQAPDYEAALANATRAIVRIATINEAITLLNEAIAAQDASGFYGTTVTTTDEQTGTTTVTLGDGWVYKKDRLTNIAGLTNDDNEPLTYTVDVEYSYTIPRKTTGNALQGVRVDFNLVVHAVQYANNTDAENTDVDISSIGVGGADATTNEAAECIRAFYAVEHEIVEAP
jgi:predicted ribosomally synthesized peptide with SipW-like signal peptide